MPPPTLPNVIPAMALTAAVLAAAVWALSAAIRLWAGVTIAQMALRDAPEPHWTAIHDTLTETRMVSPLALRIAARTTPAATAEAHQ